MKFIKLLAVSIILLGDACVAIGEQSAPEVTLTNETADENAPIKPRSDSDVLASKRYDEMLNKMQAAVEEIAELYGNPIFLQVFTNDLGSASELKEKLRTNLQIGNTKSEIRTLEKKRDALLSDIALKELQTKMLGERLIRQRTALDALATAVEQARRAVEDTAK